MNFRSRMGKIVKAIADRDLANCPPRTLFVVAPGETAPDREDLPPNCLVIIEMIVEVAKTDGDAGARS